MLFSTPMVQAIAANQKLQTRRTKGLDSINDNPNLFEYNGNKSAFGEKPFDPLYHWFERIDKKGNPTDVFTNVKCPYGQVGDIIWVRETWQHSLNPNEFAYRADCDNPLYLSKKWNPSIFMPKKACRFFLKITDIRVERLQDISGTDAIKEGCVSYGPFGEFKGSPHPSGGVKKFRAYSNPIDAYKCIWTSINGEESWNYNPWVWVISFERIEKPENFI